jgi:cell division protein FtsX
LEAAMAERLKSAPLSTWLQILTLATLLVGLGVVTFTPAENAKHIREQSKLQVELQLSLTKLASVQAGNFEDIREIRSDIRALEARLRALEILRNPRP